MRQRAAVDERGRDHRQPHPPRFQLPELIVEPVEIAQAEVGDRVQATAPSETTVAHHRFHAPMLASSAGSDRLSVRSHASP